jgi:hypothetical protein
MTLRVLDPTSRVPTDRFPKSSRPDALDGRVVGLLWNGKHNADRLLNGFGERLSRRYGVRHTVFLKKPEGVAYPAPEWILSRLCSEVDVVLTASGD